MWCLLSSCCITWPNHSLQGQYTSYLIFLLYQTKNKHYVGVLGVGDCCEFVCVCEREWSTSALPVVGEDYQLCRKTWGRFCREPWSAWWWSLKVDITVQARYALSIVVPRFFTICVVDSIVRYFFISMISVSKNLRLSLFPL